MKSYLGALAVAGAAIAVWLSVTDAGLAAASGDVALVDTLDRATHETRFSVAGSSGLAVFDEQIVGPRFTLTERTTITEIGAFVNGCLRISEGLPQCPGARPLTVQIRPALGAGPDPLRILASFTLSDDNDPMVFSYESVAVSLSLEAGSYFALFVAHEDDVGHLLRSAQRPYLYRAGSALMGVLDSDSGTRQIQAAVRVVGRPAGSDGTDALDSQDGGPSGEPASPNATSSERDTRPRDSFSTPLEFLLALHSGGLSEAEGLPDPPE